MLSEELKLRGHVIASSSQSDMAKSMKAFRSSRAGLCSIPVSGLP